jgi:hypothetical protein
MSPINFASIRNNAPELADVFEKLEDWVKNNPSVGFLEPRRLAIDLYPIAALDLAMALSALVKQHAVTLAYCVRDDRGVIVREDIRKISDVVGTTIPNRLNEYFNVKLSNILPIYRFTPDEQP